MADTPRDIDALKALLSDNLTGEISPQDLRDVLASVHGVYGGLYICEGTDSQTIASSAVETVDQWTGVQASAGFSPVAGDQKLTIPVDGVYDLAYHCTWVDDASTSEFFRVRITKNGSPIAGACGRANSPINVHYTLTARRFTECVVGDVIELEFEASSLGATRTIEIKHAGLEARLMG